MTPTFTRPDLETYLRVDDELPDGGCVDVGLEERPSDGGEEYAALQLIVERATEEMADAKQIADRIKAGVLEWFPDRYWFAEVWTPGARDGVKRYQVIQPAVVGGFKR